MPRHYRPLRLLIVAVSALTVGLMVSGCGEKDLGNKGQSSTEAASPGSPAPSPDPSQSAPPLLGDRQKTAALDRTIFFLAADAAVSHQASQILLLQTLARSSSGLGLQIADARGSKATQAAQLRQVAITQPAAIIILPVDAQDIAAEMQQARADGVLIISLDAASPDKACDTALFVNQESLGQKAGDLIVRALTQKAMDEGKTTVTGRVVELRGTDESPACTARDRGLNTALSAQPGIILVHDAPTNWSTKDTQVRVQDALRLQKTFDVIYAHNDIIAQAAAEAATTAGIRDSIFIVGTDGLGGEGLGIEALRNHRIDATFYQPYLVDLAWRIIERHRADPNFKPKPRYEFETMLITPGTLDDLQRKGYPPAPAM